MMFFRRLFLICLPGVFLVVPTNHLCSAVPDTIEFNRDVRPILSDACFACHGLDEKERKGDLRLDTAEGAYADLGGYQAVHPGNPEKSALWDRITTDDEDDIMPPLKSHKTLKPEQIAVLKRWIEQGGKYQQHWAFVAPEKPEVPPLAGGVNEIDAFVRAKLKEEGLKPATETDKETFIRRVTLDLTGLPPTREEVEEFLKDDSPDAREKLIDRLMQRVTYGEHMARPWLDLARYADTHGLHLDNERSMWPYRDWVVRAINENVPFDDFTRWQLAGDLLADPTQDQLIASGFNRCNVTTGEGGSINEEWIYRYAVERTTTTAEVWMGLTAGCAVCHDHKYDPISAKDFYSMYAFFHSAADPAMDGNKIDTPPVLKVTNHSQSDRVAELEAKIAAVDERIAAEVAKIDYQDPAQLDPLPPARETEEIWFEDAFQTSGKYTALGAPQKLVDETDGKVFSGGRAVFRKADGLAQDVLQGGIQFSVPEDGKVFAYCYLDPDNTPETVMLQFHTGGWSHRAVWGAHEKIAWGRPNTAEKVLMGKLPESGKWVRLEVDAAKMGLNPGTKVTGYAFTQFGGTVYWDKLGVSSRTDPARDPRWSYSVWVQQNEGKQIKELPELLRREIRGLRSDKWTADQAKKVKSFWLANIYAGSQDVVAKFEAEKAPYRKSLDELAKSAPITFVMADLPKPRQSYVMERGAYDKPGEKVTRQVPSFLPPLPAKAEGDPDYNRLDLANWLVNGEHPLTARVVVNRVWQQFFGTGLVRTSWDFGSQGELPSHLELLDWLAVHFVESGWDMKALVRLIVTSAAYRQSSVVTPELLDRDPDNRLLARGPRLRLEAEVVRDQALFLSGLLVGKVGGKGVRPYQPPNIWEPVGFGNSNTRYYKVGTGEDLYRRSLYTFLKRTAPPPFMATFDAPNREQSCAARSRTNTPLQALQLMNDIQHVEAARNYAQRMMKEGGESLKERLTWGWHTATSRLPGNDELAIVEGAFNQHLTKYKSDTEAAGKLISYGESKADPALDPAELAAYTMVANLLFNLDEVIMKN